jgi:hypothetical protein
MLEYFTILAQAVAVISACFAIISGVSAWKREFIGKRQIELAEQTLANFFEVKDSIAFIRNPFASSDEGKSRAKNESETKEESELLNRGYIVVERYAVKEKVFLEFNMLKYKFMASFGADTEDIFISTNKILNSIFSSARILATHYWRRQGRVQMDDFEFQNHLTEMHKHEGIFWDTLDENDEVRKQLDAIHQRIERVVAKCFEEEMTTYKLLTSKFSCKNK